MTGPRAAPLQLDSQSISASCGARARRPTSGCPPCDRPVEAWQRRCGAVSQRSRLTRCSGVGVRRDQPRGVKCL